MQKNNQKAYILIWAIFLSLIISVSFIEISTKVSKNLKNNVNIINDIGIDIQAKNLINNAQITKNYSQIDIENGDKIIFDINDKLITSLKQNENHISKINTGTTIQITIIEGGPISYKNNTLSGTISTFKSISATNGDLIINNLGSYTKFKIVSDNNKNYLSQYINYYYYKKIGNKEVIKTKGKIKNF